MKRQPIFRPTLVRRPGVEGCRGHKPPNGSFENRNASAPFHSFSYLAVSIRITPLPTLCTSPSSTGWKNESSCSLVLKFSVLSGISGGARYLWFHTFGSERDLWGCSFSMVSKFSVLSGISGGARFALFSDLSLSVLVLVFTVARVERGT